MIYVKPAFIIIACWLVPGTCSRLSSRSVVCNLVEPKLMLAVLHQTQKNTVIDRLCTAHCVSWLALVAVRGSDSDANL